MAYGHTVAGTLTVHGATTGSATVTVGSTHLSVPIGSAGGGSFTLPATLSAGTHTVAAVYNGTGAVAKSNTVTATLAVSKAATTTALSLSKTTAKHGSTVLATVTVSGHVAGLYPSGPITVKVTVDGKTTSVSVTLGQAAKGKRTVTVTLPRKAGTGKAVATYGGNGDFSSSRSATKSVTVT